MEKSNYIIILKIKLKLTKELKKHLKQLPYFLLYNYPQKMSSYEKLQKKNKSIEEKEDLLCA